MLRRHYGIAPIIVDGYDTPIQQGYARDYYEKVIGFMRNLFSGGFKDNPHLSFGLLTGILRVAKESIFSGMNNLSINSVLDNKYSAHFGVTADEVREMAQYYGAAAKYDEICQWYDGYRFGKAEILQRLENPIPPSTAISVQEAFFSGDNARLKAQIHTLLTQTVNSFDTAGENFHHGFMLGLCARLGGAFVTSNRESGDGRYDIQLKPTRKGLPGILIELKAEKNCSDEKLKQLAETALQQINEKRYDAGLTATGVKAIYKYGAAFSGKRVDAAAR